MNALVAEWRSEEAREREQACAYFKDLANRLCQYPGIAASCFQIIKNLKEESDEYHAY